MYLLLSFLAGIFIGDIWTKAGLWLIVFLILLVSVFFWKKWRVFLGIIILIVSGYLIALNSLTRLDSQRENLGNRVGWEGHERTITGTARELLSVSEFSHKYRVSVTEIDREIVSPVDISVSMPPNLSVTAGDSVTAFGRFSFPRDTPEYQSEKQLWNRGIIAEFRSFRVDKVPPQSYDIFIRMRTWFDRKLTEIFPSR